MRRLQTGGLILGAALLSLTSGLEGQTCLPGELRVIVIDSQESPVFNASVDLSSGKTALGSRSTQTTGVADFEKIPCGVWTVTATADGFEAARRQVEITGAPAGELRLVLTPKMETTRVEVKDTGPPVEQTATENNELRPAEVKQLPTNPATVNDTLPLVPGVVRDRRGELRIDGAGQERSSMVVNQSDITDPATGTFGQSVPIDSIETINVLTTPFLAQYGRFTQSVVAVETRRGGDKWHAAIKDPFPDIRARSDHLRGIRNETPRFVADGPLIANRLFFITSLQYFFQRDSSRTLPFPVNESKRQSINSFTELDWILTPKQFLTATLHISPQHANFVNLDYFNPQPAAPSYAQQNYVETLIDHFSIFRGIIDSSISFQRFDATVGAQGDANMIVTPTGNQGNFFGTQTRNAGRTEWLETWSLAPFDFWGTHLLKVGSSLTGTSDHGSFSYRPVDIENLAGQLEESIDFANQPPFSRNDLEVTAYAQDHWSFTRWFSADYGWRIEHQRLATNLRLAPRAGLALSPFKNQRTVLRAGYGLFYDHLPLDIYTFGRYPLRTITDYAPDGSIIGEPEQYLNVIGSATGPKSFFINGQQVAGAFSPRGETLNLQAEHAFAPLFGGLGLRLRAVYTDNQSVGLIVFDHEELGPVNEIVLNGNGKSRYRQTEITSKVTWKSDQQLVISYTHSHAQGNLNTFENFLGNFPPALVRDDVYSNLPSDLPNRVLVWGTLNPHLWGVHALPMVEYRTGFPYAELDAAQNYVGIPFTTRFPSFFSADFRLTKDVKVTEKYTARLSITTLNVTNHFNALEVHDNVADPQYGIFFGNYHRRYRFDFELVF